MCPAFEVHNILINLVYNWLRAEKIIGKEDEWGLVTKNHGCDIDEMEWSSTTQIQNLKDNRLYSQTHFQCLENPPKSSHCIPPQNLDVEDDTFLPPLDPPTHMQTTAQSTTTHQCTHNIEGTDNNEVMK